MTFPDWSLCCSPRRLCRLFVACAAIAAKIINCQSSCSTRSGECGSKRTRLRLVHSHGGIRLAVQSLALFFVVALDQVLFLAVALLRLVRLETKSSRSGARSCCVGLGLLQLRLLVVDLWLLLLIRVVGLLLARGRRQGVGVILRRHGDFAGADCCSVIVRQSVMATLETGARRGVEWAWQGSGADPTDTGPADRTRIRCAWIDKCALSVLVRVH